MSFSCCLRTLCKMSGSVIWKRTSLRFQRALTTKGGNCRLHVSPQWCNSWELVRFRANTTHRRRSLYGQDWSKLFQISLICRQSHLKLRNEKLFDRNSFLQIFKVVVVSFICTRHLEALKRNLWHDIFLYLKIICSVYVLGSIIKLIPKAVTSFFAHFSRRRHRKIRIIVHKM